jgi:hypothetical protein
MQVFSRITSYLGSHDGALTFYESLRVSDRRLSRSAGFNSLPDDCAESEQDRPRRYPLRPCYEFVPPWRLIAAIGCLGCAVAINGYGRGWIRLLCAFFILCAGWLIMDGHRYWCKGEDGNYHEYSHAAKLSHEKAAFLRRSL